MITRVDRDLPAQVAASAAANGRGVREEAENQHRVGLLTDRALTEVYALADDLDRMQRALEHAQDQEDARAAAPPTDARWNPSNRTWEIPSPGSPGPEVADRSLAHGARRDDPNLAYEDAMFRAAVDDVVAHDVPDREVVIERAVDAARERFVDHGEITYPEEALARSATEQANVETKEDIDLEPADEDEELEP